MAIVRSASEGGVVGGGVKCVLYRTETLIQCREGKVNKHSRHWQSAFNVVWKQSLLIFSFISENKTSCQIYKIPLTCWIRKWHIPITNHYIGLILKG